MAPSEVRHIFGAGWFNSARKLANLLSAGRIPYTKTSTHEAILRILAGAALDDQKLRYVGLIVLHTASAVIVEAIRVSRLGSQDQAMGLGGPGPHF